MSQLQPGKVCAIAQASLSKTSFLAFLLCHASTCCICGHDRAEQGTLHAGNETVDLRCICSLQMQQTLFAQHWQVCHMSLSWLKQHCFHLCAIAVLEDCMLITFALTCAAGQTIRDPPLGRWLLHIPTFRPTVTGLLSFSSLLLLPFQLLLLVLQSNSMMMVTPQHSNPAKI